MLTIDQRKLPARLEYVTFYMSEEIAEAIRNMTIRGAPVIGAAAAYGLALTASRSRTESIDVLLLEMNRAADNLRATRPTAASLNWALERVLHRAADCHKDVKSIDELKTIVLQEAQRIANEDVQVNRKMAEHGESLIDDGDTIIHHCNTGSLATVDWGTALGVIRMAWEKGKRVRVLVDETRPRLQGSRLTAWELEQYGIPYEIISDNMAGYFLSTGKVQKVFFGADRIAANGDVANKVGTYMLALAAKDNGIPVYCVAPTVTIDLNTATGAQIPIEERPESEVLDIELNGEKVTPAGAKARNPAFDITPSRLITAIVTEKGVIHPPYEDRFRWTSG